MEFVVVLIAVGLSTIALFCYIAFIWWLDRYEREPLWIVGLAAAWGALGGTCLSCAINSTFGALLATILDPQGAQWATTVLVAPLVEELIKGLAFAGLLAFGNQLDNRTDGLIYGAAAGLGFAVVENLWYYAAHFDLSSPLAVLPVIALRTLFSAIVHATSSALLGMAIGYARHRRGAARWLIFPALGYAAAVANHAAWNGLSTLSGALSGDGGEGAALGAGVFLLAIVLLLLAAALLFGLTQHSLHAEHVAIERFLTLEAERGVIPKEHVEVIPYWSRRRRSDWLEEYIPRDEYVRTATLLAFRHHQLEVAGGERRERYLEEIAAYRARVRELLARPDGAS